MTLTANQQTIENLYKEVFGEGGAGTRTGDTGSYADFSNLGGATYWVDKLDKGTSTAAEVKDMLLGSSEATTGYLGGVNPNVGTGHSSNVGSWADHFKDGGVFGAVDASGNPNSLAGTIWEGMGGGAAGNQGTDDSATALNTIAAATGAPINNLSGAYYNMGSTGGGDTGGGDTGGGDTGGGDAGLPGTPDYLTSDDLTTWWDALDKSAFTGNQSSGGGMNDFMQFMMFMNMMRPQGGMGGGSQYGYGGLNPGGVQSAYNPMDNFQGMMDAFNTLKGGTTTNTGTT